MKVKSGSDWLVEQEKLARRKIAELQRAPGRTASSAVLAPAQNSEGAATLAVVMRLLFILGVLLLVMSFGSFCGMLLFTFSGNMKVVMELLALPVAFPVFSLIGGDFGPDTTFYRNIASGSWGIFLITLLLSYFLGYAPDKIRKKRKKVTRRSGETSSQKRKRNTELEKWQEKLKNIQAGREAEEKTSHLLATLLNDNWTLYRNVTLPDGRNDDIDAVLIGPNGVYNLEVKAYSGLHRYSTGEWKVAMGGGAWETKDWNPARQAADGSQRIKSFLASQGLGGINVQPRVVWGGKGRVEVVGQPPVQIWFMSSRDIGSFLKKDLMGGNTRLRSQDLSRLELALEWVIKA